MNSLKKWLLAATPLIVLGLTALAVTRGGVLEFLKSGAPPIEDLSFNYATLEPGLITVEVINGGPDPITIAQVLVDEAYWRFTIEPSETLRSLATARIQIPFPWVQDEPHEIRVLTSTGLTFDHTIEVATVTPKPDARYFSVFTVIGLYVGVIPVAIGLLWLPLLRDASKQLVQFSLALTAGLLIFLGADSLIEAFEAADSIAGGLQGDMAVVIGFVTTLLLLQTLGRRRPADRTSQSERSGSRWSVAFSIALGIGIHNLGEGLAIGAAYALGELTLGASLVLGFMFHNTTEGLAIVAPVAHERAPVRRLVALGLLAGAPTILGALLGGLAYSPFMAALFLSIGAGAIAQVVISLSRLMAQPKGDSIWTPVNASGVIAGLALMYFTGLFAMA